MPDPRRHGRRYLVRLALAVVGYGVLLAGSLLIAQQLSGPGRIAVMLVPVPALLAVVWAVARYLREVDEMLRDRLLRSLALGFAIGSVLTFSYGLMQAVGAPEVPWTMVWPVYAVSWLVATLLVWQRDR